ncbi:MAG: LysR family transcriptional regulator [Mycobacterium sp.]
MPLSSRMPDLAALEALLAIARTGSLTAAGLELGLTQQAISARVTAMEAQTGVRLIVRTKRGSTLTPAGVVAAQWSDRLLEMAQQVDAGLATLRADTRSRVRVSASLTIAEQLLPRWLVTMQASAARHGTTAPEVILTATNSDHVLSDVRDDKADLGFVESPGVPRGVRSRVIAHDELVVVVPVSHKWARRSLPITPSELNATSLVSREPGSGTREFLSAALSFVLDPGTTQAAPALEFSTAAAVRAAVLAGAGPAVISRLAVEDELVLGRLQAVPIAGLDLRRELRAVWLGARTPPAGAIRELLSHIATVSKAERRRDSAN